MSNALQVLFGTFAEAESKDFSEPIDDGAPAEDYDYYSDSDLEEDEDITNSEERPKTMDPLRGHPFGLFCFPFDDRKSTRTCGEHDERPENLKGKVVRIQDVAFITYVLSGT